MSARRAIIAAACASSWLALAGCREEGVTPREAVAGGDPARGRAAVARFGCGGCHVVPGVPGAVGRVGPSLAGLAARPFVAGALPNDAETLVRWIRAPQALRPGTAMPDLAGQLARGEFLALREWLRDNLHRHGRKFTPKETLRRAAGADHVDVGPYVTYLRSKFSAIYGLPLAADAV